MSPRRAPAVKPCAGTCGRLLRPTKTTRDDYPGTIVARSGGYCKPCLDGTPDKAPPPPTPSHCVHCGSRMRPHDAKVADHPDTYRHIGGGACYRCYNTEGPMILDPEAVRPDFDVVQARAALEAWLADRRRGNVHHFPTRTPNTEPERIAA